MMICWHIEKNLVFLVNQQWRLVKQMYQVLTI